MALAVCYALDIPYDDLAGAGRHTEVLYARIVYTNANRVLTCNSWSQIARGLGRTTHSALAESWKLHRSRPSVANDTEQVARILACTCIPKRLSSRVEHEPRVGGMMRSIFLDEMRYRGT